VAAIHPVGSPGKAALYSTFLLFCLSSIGLYYSYTTGGWGRMSKWKPPASLRLSRKWFCQVLHAKAVTHL